MRIIKKATSYEVAGELEHFTIIKFVIALPLAIEQCYSAKCCCAPFLVAATWAKVLKTILLFIQHKNNFIHRAAFAKVLDAVRPFYGLLCHCYSSSCKWIGWRLSGRIGAERFSAILICCSRTSFCRSTCSGVSAAICASRLFSPSACAAFIFSSHAIFSGVMFVILYSVNLNTFCIHLLQEVYHEYILLSRGFDTNFALPEKLVCREVQS